MFWRWNLVKKKKKSKKHFYCILCNSEKKKNNPWYQINFPPEILLINNWDTDGHLY